MTGLTLVSLLFASLLVSSASAQGGLASCCRRTWNFQVHRDRLSSYYKQDRSSCPVHAVVFSTLRGKRICADPRMLWTKTSMAYIDGKNWRSAHPT